MALKGSKAFVAIPYLGNAREEGIGIIYDKKCRRPLAQD